MCGGLGLFLILTSGYSGWISLGVSYWGKLGWGFSAPVVFCYLFYGVFYSYV